MSGPPEIRASHAEREQAVRALGDHAAAGRLTLAELEERVERALRAVSRAELEALARDLPDVAPPTTRRGKVSRWLVAVMGGSDRKGRWRVGERFNAVTVMGGADIDLREVELDGDQVTIVAVAVMGGIDIYVPDSVEVDVGGFALMGGNDQRGSHRAPRDGAPVVRVRAYALMGGVDVWRLPAEARGLELREAKRIASGSEGSTHEERRHLDRR